MGLVQVHDAAAALGLDGGEALVRGHTAAHQGPPLRAPLGRDPRRLCPRQG